MTQDEIIEMATKVYGECDWHESALHHLEAFAKLVEDKVRQEIIEKNAPVIKKVNEHIKELQDAVKTEREACAEIAEKQRYAMNISLTSHPAQNGTAVQIANAIRARGEA
jgi:hypothetical protein